MSSPTSRTDPESAFGYHTATVQAQFQAREASGPAQFFIPYLESGMTLLDVGCGPGTVTQGLARLVAPAEAVGCDLEAGMVARAAALAEAAGVTNARFEVGNILDLPFADETFDAIYSGAVTEHLRDPGAAIGELARVARAGALVAITRTDWAAPLMSPAAPAMERFFELLEAGFQLQGGTMNGGRHLRTMAHAAGLTEVEFFAAYTNATDTAAVSALVSDYVEWVENMPIFEQVAAAGLADASELQALGGEMQRWARQPGAFLAITTCRLVARKS